MAPSRDLFGSHAAGYPASMDDRGWAGVDGPRQAIQTRRTMHGQAPPPPGPVTGTRARPTRSVALVLALLLAVSAVGAATMLPARFTGFGIATLSPAGGCATAAEDLSSATRHAERLACADADVETASRIALRGVSHGVTGGDGRPDATLAGARGGSRARPRGRRDGDGPGGSGSRAASSRASRRRPINEAASGSGSPSSIPPGRRPAVLEATGGRF